MKYVRARNRQKQVLLPFDCIAYPKSSSHRFQKEKRKKKSSHPLYRLYCTVAQAQSQEGHTCYANTKNTYPLEMCTWRCRAGWCMRLSCSQHSTCLPPHLPTTGFRRACRNKIENGMTKTCSRTTAVGHMEWTDESWD